MELFQVYESSIAVVVNLCNHKPRAQFELLCRRSFKHFISMVLSGTLLIGIFPIELITFIVSSSQSIVALELMLKLVNERIFELIV